MCLRLFEFRFFCPISIIFLFIDEMVLHADIHDIGNYFLRIQKLRGTLRYRRNVRTVNSLANLTGS